MNHKICTKFVSNYLDTSVDLQKSGSDRFYSPVPEKKKKKKETKIKSKKMGWAGHVAHMRDISK
jgi:hypothetical protein